MPFLIVLFLFWNLSERVPLTEGKSVQEMVDEALRHVPNSDGWFSYLYMHAY